MVSGSDFATEVGRRVASARREQGLTLDELARLSGVGIATLSHLENATRDVRLSTLGRVLSALRLPGSALFTPAPRPETATGAPAEGYDLDD